MLASLVSACAGPAPAPPADATGAATAAPIVQVVTATPGEPPASAAPTAAPAALPTLPAWTPVPTAYPDALYVDAAQSLGAINPLVYGSNFGPWAGIMPDLKPQLLAAHITYLRFPGGAYGDDNNLQNYQIDNFISMAREMGAEPSISVRLLDGTPEAAAAIVQYVNVTRQYHVRYWSIGNEPDLYARSKNIDYDTQRHNREWRAIALAMRAVDPGITLIGPDLTGAFSANEASNPKDASRRDWLREFLRANGDLVDVVSIHRYPFPRDVNAGPPIVDDLRRNPRELDATIPYLRGVIRELTGRDLPVAVTEINSNWSNQCCGDATPDSLYNAIWWSDALGRLIRQKVDIVAQFSLQSGPVAAGSLGLLATYDVRPIYYVYRMYAHFGQDLLQASSDENDVTIYAARRADGALTLMIVNLSRKPAGKQLVLHHFTPAAQAETWLLDRDHKAEKVAATALEATTNLSLPAQSVTLLIVPAK